MENVLENEIELLQSMFCQSNEFIMNARDGAFVCFSIQVKFNTLETRSHILKLTVSCHKDYPRRLPDFSLVSPSLTNHALQKIKEDLLLFIGNVHVVEDEGDNFLVVKAINWIQENSPTYLYHESKHDDSDLGEKQVEKHVKVLKLDHIRSRVKYLSNLKAWTYEHEIFCLLVAYQHLIYVLLQGDERNIKEFMKCFKMRNVDVDSSGRPCKERMMSVIVEQKCHLNEEEEKAWKSEFISVQCEDRNDFYFWMQKYKVLSSHFSIDQG